MASTGEPYGLFWNSNTGDRTYDASSFEYWLKKFFTSGVFAEELQVTATSGMTLEVSAGYANVDGKVKFWNAPFTVTLDAANSTYPRIDTVVIRRDNVNREIVCEKVTGGYSGDDPVPTAPVRNSEIYELVIAQIYIAAGATEVTQSVITDTRPDLDLCGYITGTVQNLDFSQLMAQFETYFEEYKASFEQTMSDWESAQELSYASWFNSIVNQYTSDKTEWDAWYADLRASLHMLPQDSAEYLQVEINELQETASGSIFNIDTIQPTLVGQAVTVASEDGTEVKTATFEAYRNRLENTGESQTINGITYTVMANGTVVANGTASAESRFYINEEFTATAGQKLSGCPADGSAVTYQLRVGASADDSAVGIDVGSGYTLSAGTYKISINIASGRTVNNLVFSPMVRDASDTNEDYEEYSEYVAHARIVGVTYVGDLTVQSTDSLQTATLVADVPYFARYHVVLAFWQATVNIQGDTNLYGATITVKDSSDVTVGSVTLSAMDGTGTFYAAYPDTYTFNYTFSGTDYSEELVVDEEITYTLELTAGFSWQTWVDTASELDSSDYDSLDEVLEDEAALRELFLEHACVDYMASVDASNEDLETVINNDLCAKWINNNDYALDFLGANTVIKALMDTADKYGYGEWVITDNTTTPPTWGAKGNVPVMTSNTAPYGGVAALSAHSSGNNPAWKAFDGNASTEFASAYTSGRSIVGDWLRADFVNPIKVKRIYISQLVNQYSASSVRVQASDDINGTWTDLGTYEIASADISSKFIDITNDNYYLHYMVVVATAYGSSEWNVATLQFYGRELKVSVPTMTSNTAPYGEAIANREYPYAYGTKYAYYAYDNSNSTDWSADSAYESTSWLGYKFLIPTSIKRILFSGHRANASIDQSPKDFKIQYSDNGVDFVTLSDETYGGNPTAGAYNWKSYDVNHNDAHKYWRLLFLTYQPSSNGNWSVNGLQFYGLDYSEKEFEAGTTKKWLYDHGVEFETIDTTNATKDSDKITIQGTSTSTGVSSGISVASIDFTPYNTMRAKFGDRIGWIALAVNTGVGTTNITYNAVNTGDANLPNNLGLNISSVNETKNATIYLNANYLTDVKEWWLE